MVESPEPASGTRGPRNRRQPSRQPSPTPSSRPRRSNARASGPPPVTTIKKEEPARKRRPSSMEASNLEDSANDDDEENAEERDEDEQGEGEGEEGEEGEEEVEDEKEPVPTKRPGRPSRSKRPIRNGRSVTKSRPQGDGDVVENNQASTDKADGGATEEQAEEDPEENEGEIEEAGEAKITKDGELLGGREYKCRSFRMPNRGSRIYMLSMDPARVLGFRDSYLFFLRNPSLVRINTTVEERTWMIENGMLMANFKSKLIAVVTARSIFKMFGHRIIKRGRSKIDDYYESRAVEDDVGDESDEDMAGDPDGSQGSGTHEDGTQGRRKHTLFHTDEPVRQVTDLNWMYESAMAVRSLNTQLRTLRQENPKFLDPHTNIEQIPAAKQPTRCEVVPVLQSKKEAPSAIQSENTLNQTVLSIPHSIGPQVDAVVKVEIKEGVPPPPIIQDPAVWAVIPEDIRKALEIAEATKPKDEENEDLAKFPLSLMDGQYQAAFPIHQARFQQPYRVVLPQSMAPFAHYLHQLYTTQSRGEVGPTMEQATVLGQGDARALQWQQQHQLQQQQMQLHQKQIKNQQQQQQQQQQQIQDQPNKKLETPPSQGIYCGAPLKTGHGYCQRLVSAQGERCPNHRGSQTSQPGTPQANGKLQGICGECNQAIAPHTAVPADKPLPCPMSYLNTCKTCSNSFHPVCLQLDTARIVSAIASYPWQCNDCKLCVVCMEAGDEASLLICDDCDRGWHMSCCDPAIREVPRGEWLCSFCAMCHSCRGAEIPGTRYKHAIANPTGANKYPTYLCTYCINCHDSFTKGRYCPVCLRTYRGDGGEDDSDAVGEDENNMVCCDECNRWVHMDCDGELSEDKVEEMGQDESLKYTCPPCSGKVVPLRPGLAPVNVTQEVILQSLHGQTIPQPKVCGILGGKMRVRGLMEHQGKKVGIPEIIGTGVEYDRKMVSELTALKNKGSAAFRRRRGRPMTKSPAAGVRRASIASSTSSSLSSLTGSVDS